MNVINDTKEAPTYFGEKNDTLPFFDNEYNRARDDFDDYVMEALVAICIDESRCPTSGEWVHFCIANTIAAVVTEDTLIAIPKNPSLQYVEKLSWTRLWNVYRTGQLNCKFNNKNFEEALLRIFIIRHHTADGPGRPYNQSYFVRRWGFSFNLFPDTLNDKTCNVRLCHLQRGRHIFNTFSNDIRRSIKLISNFLPLILKEVNIAIKA